MCAEAWPSLKNSAANGCRSHSAARPSPGRQTCRMQSARTAEDKGGVKMAKTNKPSTKFDIRKRACQQLLQAKRRTCNLTHRIVC